MNILGMAKVNDLKISRLKILPQPDETTCGPTCLHSIYHYYGSCTSLADVIKEVRTMKDGGTLAVWLACHALQNGFRATIYSYNLQLFDPTWFHPKPLPLEERLNKQMKYKRSNILRLASEGYLEFLKLGGVIKVENLSRDLIRYYLNRNIPILTGLSATYLYRTPREYGPKNEYDEIRGEPSGHFVVLCGYKKKTREVLVADPFLPNPTKTHKYLVFIDRLINAILLGILTYDANLLIIQP